MITSVVVRSQFAVVLMAVAAIGSGALPSYAAGHADLEERIAELEATTARKGNTKVKLEVSGFINEALLYWDDGLESNLYQGTNDTQRSRFRFKGSAKISGDWSAGYLLEIGVRGNRLTRTDEATDEGGGSLDLRYSAWYVANKNLGEIWVGNTSFATDAITELNTANLKHFARINASKWNMSNRIIVDGVRSTDRRWRDLLPTDGVSGDNAPGEGDRASSSVTRARPGKASRYRRPGEKTISGIWLCAMPAKLAASRLLLAPATRSSPTTTC